MYTFFIRNPCQPAVVRCSAKRLFCPAEGGSGRVHERSERKTTVLRSEEGVAKKTGALGARTLERGGDFPLPVKKSKHALLLFRL